MKSRLSYFLISGIIILSILTGIFIWRNKHLNQIPKFNEKSFNAPITSKYIPTNADFIFHWKFNPTTFPKQIGTNQDKVNKKITFIRDSSFKLISLDFERDISRWAGEYGSFAIFDSNEQLLNDWILVLGIKDNVNIEEELASIVDPETVDQSITSNDKLRTPSIEINSKRINSNNSIYFASDKDKVLISSKPQIIKSSISNLDSNSLNTKKRYKNIQLKDNLNDGIFLLEMSPKNILKLIGEEKNILELNDINNLISSINIYKNQLKLEGIISYDVKTQMPVEDINYNLINIEKESESSKDFIFVDNPKQYFSKVYSHPYQKFINSVIKESTTSDYSNLFKIILENSNGNLLWINDKGWVALTRKSNTRKKEIIDILSKNKFSNSNLDFKNKNLEIWSKISTNDNEKYEIKENIEAIIEENEGSYIWSQSLSSLSLIDQVKYLANNLDSENKKDKVNDFDDIIRIHLGKEKTKTVLNSFYPYILFKTLLGNKLNAPNNIDMSIAVPTINYPDFIKFKITLKTS